MRRALALACALLIASCAAPEAAPEPEPEPGWGAEVLEYFGAFAGAASRGDLEQTIAFFDDESRLIDSAGVSAIGLRRIDMAMRSAMSVDSERRPGSVLVALEREEDLRRGERAGFGLVPGDALLFSEVRFGTDLGCPADRAPCVLRELALVTVSGSHIDAYSTMVLLADVAAFAPDDPELQAALAALTDFHRVYAATWSSASPDEVARLYDRYARVEHHAWEISVRGRESVSSAVSRLREDHGDVQWAVATLEDLGIPSDDPAVFFAGSPVEPHVMSGLYRVAVPGGEPALVAVVWRRAPNGIAHEWSAWEVGSHAVADLVSAGEPWWSGLEVPWVEPAECAPSDGAAVEVCNGTPELLAEVRWALSRFDAAGLSLPRPSRISYPPNSRCRQVPGEGWAVDTGDGVDLLLCRIDDLQRLRFVLLHELGHVWSNQYLDEARRDAFVDSRGLDGWRDPEGEWRDQGSEHAAEILAWGLMDHAVPMSRLPDAGCARLAEGFRMLTGHEPLVTVEECEAG